MSGVLCFHRLDLRYIPRQKWRICRQIGEINDEILAIKIVRWPFGVNRVSLCDDGIVIDLPIIFLEKRMQFGLVHVLDFGQFLFARKDQRDREIERHQRVRAQEKVVETGNVIEGLDVMGKLRQSMRQ